MNQILFEYEVSLIFAPDSETYWQIRKDAETRFPLEASSLSSFQVRFHSLRYCRGECQYCANWKNDQFQWIIEKSENSLNFPDFSLEIGIVYVSNNIAQGTIGQAEKFSKKYKVSIKIVEGNIDFLIGIVKNGKFVKSE